MSLFTLLAIKKVNFWMTVCKRFALYYQTVICLSCNVGVLWPAVGWIKMPLGRDVGLGPGHIVLDGEVSQNQIFIF